jgi:Ulp1 family protease
VSHSVGDKAEFDQFIHLVSTPQSKELYSLYRDHILAPCHLCCSDRAKNYLNCAHCTNRKISPLCGSVFSKTTTTTGISDLRRLRNPREFMNDKESSLWMNDEIVNAYLALLSRKFPRNKSHGTNFFFSSFFMDKLMNLSKMSSIEDAGYNYGAVRNWVERMLLPKQSGTTRRYTRNGFGDFVSSAVLYIPINWGAHWIMATVHMDQHTICIYDSLSPTTRTFDDSGYGTFGLAILRCLNELYEEWKLGELDVHDWTCHFPSCARQTNDVDCGVFMLAYIHMLVCGISPTSCIEGQCWRNLILNSLVAGEILCRQAEKNNH